jgi:hypothetical protein
VERELTETSKPVGATSGPPRLARRNGMAYRNKTYIAFDADNDMQYYRLLTAWKKNGRFPNFDFYDAHEINNLKPYSSEETIKRRLLERLRNTKLFVLLIGQHTKNLYRYVRWEIQKAIEFDIPIIAININKKRERDNDRCPPALRDELAIHISFEQKIIEYAFDHWIDKHRQHRKNGDTGAYRYKSSVYKDLGL